MKDLLISILEAFGYPVFLQGTWSEDKEYPDSFITFFTDNTTNGADYDNDTAVTVWDFTVIFYSDNPALVSSVPDKIKENLKQAGFIPQGKGSDILSDVPTHTGWVQNYYFLEREGLNNA